ncbi:VOC family protein [Ferrovibrio xuzhouensis]|uniref:VOC family protein n=1 Tax=Ferrovibrio xuzhouensis TaxID=1576914 RepID=A0ABV7VMU4_9PROT
MSRIFGAVRQLGYVVHDIEKAMKHWTDNLGIGPFVYIPRVGMSDFRYRGKPYEIELSIALANSGDVQIELIQQRNDVPSIYADDLRKYGEVLHHTSSWTTSYDDDVKRILDAGHTPVQEARIGGNRLAYFECGPGYPSTTMEIYDVSGRAGAFNDRIRQAAVSWDGSDPVRGKL